MRCYPGGITLTRCLGGLPLKTKPTRIVTAAPQSVSRRLDGTEAFVILACDGVWDVLDARAACDVVKASAPHDAAESLCQAAHARGSTDNITAVVVFWPLDEA